MKACLNLFRWPNLVLIFIAHLLFRFSFLDGFSLNPSLGSLYFFLLSLCILLVAAAGNVINDIFDVKTDFVNKRPRPIAQRKISISKAYSVYVIFNLIAIFISVYISYKLQEWLLLIIVMSVIILLFAYARYIKSIPILSNVLVSLLVSLSFVLVLYFDAELLSSANHTIFSWVIFYSVFAFWANLNREWIKDAIDVKGDYAQNMKTLPILIGKSRLNILIFLSTLLLIPAILYGVKVYLKANLFFSLYFIFGICMPLLFVLYKIWKDENQQNYKLLSNIYKIVMLIGVCSLILFKI